MAKKSAAQQAKAEARLRAQRRLFVDAYVECLNATEAAKRAGYSAKTARQQGSRLLTSVDVREAIDKGLEARQMGKAEVLVRLADMASASMEDFVEPQKGRGLKIGAGVIDLKKAKRLGKLHLIRKLKVGVDGTSIELYDAQAALEKLGRYHKLFVDRHEHTGKDGGPLEFADVKARLLSRFDQGDEPDGEAGVPGEPAG